MKTETLLNSETVLVLKAAVIVATILMIGVYFGNSKELDSKLSEVIVKKIRRS